MDVTWRQDRSVGGPLTFCQAVMAFYERDNRVLADTTAAAAGHAVLPFCFTDRRATLYEKKTFA